MDIYTVLFTGSPHTNPENQFLAALTLCWLFTSSNRAIRDKSTKALTNILLARSDIFPKLLEQFKDVDDLYVLERLLAAAYGACCLDPDPERLNTYSVVIFKLVFENGEPPFGILLRDYAFGVIELAAYHSALPDMVDFERCKPPYKSLKPELSVSEKRLNEVAKKAGGDGILYSTAKHYMGDFARYEIKPRVGYFLNVSLEEEIPLSDEQRAQLFKDEVLGGDLQRLERYEVLERITDLHWQALSELTAEDQKERINAYTHIFLQLLTEEEVKRFYSDAAPYLYERKRTHQQEQGFDMQAIQRWIAKRAYDYGWTSERFPDDSSKHDHYSRDRPAVECIGKKYQWLAFDELLSRLADNYWLKEDYGHDLPRPYASPLDLGVARDIDPTILEEKAVYVEASPILNSWAFEPWIKLDEIEEEQFTDWPFEKDPAEQLKTLPFRTDTKGEKWLVIYEHQSKTQKYKELLGERIGEHDSRIQEFRFLETAIVKTADVRKIAKDIESKGLSGGVGWSVLDCVDSAFLHESLWRTTWRQEKWSSEARHLPEEEQHAQLAARYCWKSHLDAALPDGYSAHLPLPWLIRELNLHVDSEQAGVWRDQNDEIIFQEFEGEEGGSVCLIKQDKVNEILGECTFLTLLIAERNAWPRGRNGHAAWRRTEGVCWKDGRGMNVRSWSQDQQK